MATRPKAVIESRNGEKFSPITIAKNILTDDGQNLHDILSDRKEDMMTPTIENSSSMFKVGQGDNVDYSSNVVNGAYESCVFKGKSLVNISNKAQEIEILGRVNTHTQIEIANKDLLKRNTKYILILGYDVTFDTNSPNKTLYLDDGHGYTYIKGLTKRNIATDSGKGVFVSIITTKDEEKTSNSNIHITLFKGSDSNRVIISNLMLIEYQEGMENWDIPYFTGLCDVKMPILRNVGKNLINEQNNTDGRFVWTTGEEYSDSNTIRTDFVRVPSNTTVYSDYKAHFFLYDRDKQYLGVNEVGNKTSSAGSMKNTLTIDSSVTYVRIYWDKTSGENNQLTVSSTATPYENHKTNILRTSEEIVLRSLPGGVCDTLNVETGEYTRKIGEIIIDGSENWELSANFSSTYNAYYFVSNETFKNNLKFICDKYKISSYSEIGNTIGLAMGTSGDKIAPFITSDKMTLSEFKEYLSKNPTTIQYELATPIVSTVDIQGFPHAYTNGHVLLSSGHSGQSLTPKVEYSVVTNRNGQIRSNQKMVERHQKQLDRLQAMILTNLVNTQYEQTLTNLKYDLKNVREEVK